MALQRMRRKENVPGDFYVDNTCIDCDLCRQIAPESFHQAGEMSAVFQQPQTAEQVLEAMKALVTCPTASIGTVIPRSAKAAVDAYPELIEDDVYFCGFASADSYGASSYLIVRRDGNVLVDSPRFLKPLARRIEKMGGIRYIFLTHRDDVADHEQWTRHFEAERIMHRDDAGKLRDVIEILIDGSDTTALSSDLLVIPTPGHTRGHMVLLYKNHFLFTGDHLNWSVRYRSLNAPQSVCWYSWAEQLKSVEKLMKYDFAWVLPGHGRRAHGTPESLRNELEQCLERYGAMQNAE